MGDWKQKFDDVKSLYEQVAAEKKVVERDLIHYKRREPMVQMLWSEIVFLRKALQKSIKQGLRIVMDVPSTRIEDENAGREMLNIGSLGVLQATMARDTWMNEQDPMSQLSVSRNGMPSASQSSSRFTEEKWGAPPARPHASQADAMGVEKWLPSDGASSVRHSQSWRRGGVSRTTDHGMSMKPYNPLAIPSHSRSQVPSPALGPRPEPIDMPLGGMSGGMNNSNEMPMSKPRADSGLEPWSVNQDIDGNPEDLYEQKIVTIEKQLAEIKMLYEEKLISEGVWKERRKEIINRAMADGDLGRSHQMPAPGSMVGGGGGGGGGTGGYPGIPGDGPGGPSQYPGGSGGSGGYPGHPGGGPGGPSPYPGGSGGSGGYPGYPGHSGGGPGGPSQFPGGPGGPSAYPGGTGGSGGYPGWQGSGTEGPGGPSQYPGGTGGPSPYPGGTGGPGGYPGHPGDGPGGPSPYPGGSGGSGGYPGHPGGGPGGPSPYPGGPGGSGGYPGHPGGGPGGPSPYPGGPGGPGGYPGGGGGYPGDGPGGPNPYPGGSGFPGGSGPFPPSDPVPPPLSDAPFPPSDELPPMAPPMDGDGPPDAPPMDMDGPPMAPDMDDDAPLPPGVGGGPFGVKPTKKAIKPGQRMKPLHWKRVLVGGAKNPNPVLQNSLWSNINSINEKVEKEIDIKELEELFAKAPEKKAKSKGGKNDKKEEKSAPQKVQLLEPKRHNQLAIMLSQMPPYDDIAKAVLNLDTTKLTRDQLENLYKAVPTAEEITIVVKGTKDVPKDTLQGPERFILAVAQVPQLAARVDCWRFSLSFDETFDDIYKPLDEMLKACKTILQSKDWQKLMSVILCVGNYLNGGGRMGQADGFHLEILEKLSRVKDNSGSVSLLDYIIKLCVKQFGKKFFDTLKKEFEVVKTVQMLSLKTISSEGRTLMGNARLNQKMHSLVTGSSTIKDDKFDKVISKFNGYALKKCDDLASKVKNVHASFVQTLLYHEPDMPQDEADTYATEEFFQLIFGFVNAIHYAYQQQVASEEAKIKKEKQEEAMRALKEKKQGGSSSSSSSSDTKTSSSGSLSGGRPTINPSLPSDDHSPNPVSPSMSSAISPKNSTASITVTTPVATVEKPKHHHAHSLGGMLNLVRKKSSDVDLAKNKEEDGPQPPKEEHVKKIGGFRLFGNKDKDALSTPSVKPRSGSSATTPPNLNTPGSTTTTTIPESSTSSSPSGKEDSLANSISSSVSRLKKPAPLNLSESKSPASPSSTGSASPRSPSSPTGGGPPSPTGTGPVKKKKKKILWQEHKDQEGDTYYYNLKTGESSWQKPPDFPY